MHRKALLVLAVVAVVAVIAAAWLTHERRATPAAETGGPLVAGLADSINSIARVRIEDGTGSVTLERGESGWRIVERGGYPADMQQLRRKLLALSEARLVEKKTANPDNYALLGVADPQPAPDAAGSDADAGDDDESGTRVTLEGLPEPLSLIIGKRNFRGTPSTYVRRDGETQSWLASGDLALEADPKEWLKRDVVDIGTPRIQRVTLTQPDGSAFTIEKASREAPDFAVVDVPEGRELLSPGAANSIAGALGNLRLDDVRPAAEIDSEGVSAVAGVYETFDGLRIRTRAWESDDKRYLSLTVEFDESLIPPAPEAAEADVDQPDTSVEADSSAEAADAPPAQTGEAVGAAPDDAPEAADPAAVAEALSGAAVELAAAVEGWVFEIPSYKYSNLSKPLEDLLKPLETEDAAD